MPERVASVLEQAKEFRVRKRRSNDRVTWADYEFFKHLLQDAGFFGYEGKLADALGL